MVRIWHGHESLITRLPSTAPSSSLPSPSTMAGWTPNNGRVADPVLKLLHPQWRNQNTACFGLPPCINNRAAAFTNNVVVPVQASGLIGSPTEPSKRRLLRLLSRTNESPSRIMARIAVGAVYKIETLCLSTT